MKPVKFTDLDFQQHPSFAVEGSFFHDKNAIRAVARFDNDYGLSIVRFPGSHGYYQGLYEAAVLKFTGEDFRLCQIDEFEDDVIGYLSPSDIDALLETVEQF